MLKPGRILVVIGAVALFLSACGKENQSSQTPPENSGVYGTWLGPTQEIPTVDGSLKIIMKIKIEANRISNISECSWDGPGLSATAIASANAEVSDSQIIVRGSDTQKKPLIFNGANAECTARVNAGTIDYTVSENSLSMSNEGSAPISMVRVQ